MHHSYVFSAMPKLIFDLGIVGRLGEIAAPFGRRPLLVTGAGALERSGNLPRMRGDLKSVGVKVHQFRIAAEPSPAMVDEAVNDFWSKEIDVGCPDPADRSYVFTHASPLTDALAMDGMHHLIQDRR